MKNKSAAKTLLLIDVVMSSYKMLHHKVVYVSIGVGNLHVILNKVSQLSRNQ